MTIPTTQTLTGLENGTSYEVTVKAVNAAGTGPASTPAFGTPKAPVTPPGGGGLTAPANYTSKTFSDYFTASTLSSAWIPGVGDNFYGPWPASGVPSPATACGSGSSGYDAEYFTPAQVSVGNGLVITAQLDSTYKNYKWKSGCIRLANQLVGANKARTLVQVRAKLAGGTGMWPGLWAQIAAANPSGSNSELDLIEGGYGSGSTPTNKIMQITQHLTNVTNPYNTGVDLSADYHVYGWEYIPGSGHNFFFDYKQIWSQSTTISAAYDFKINLQVAENSVGWHPVWSSSTPSPEQFLVSGFEIWNGYTGTSEELGAFETSGAPALYRGRVAEHAEAA